MNECKKKNSLFLFFDWFSLSGAEANSCFIVTQHTVYSRLEVWKLHLTEAGCVAVALHGLKQSSQHYLHDWCCKKRNIFPLMKRIHFKHLIVFLLVMNSALLWNLYFLWQCLCKNTTCFGRLNWTRTQGHFEAPSAQTIVFMHLLYLTSRNFTAQNK